VSDGLEYQAALAALRERYPQYTAMRLEIDTHPLIRIVPQHVHFWSSATASGS
jgi:hypothetical protein